jgi:glycosyltransferase involved in cell wall biosynthesis
MIEELKLKENIEFDDYFPKQSDMHKHIQQAKYAVLPVKLDVISGTIIDAMQIGLPVITYKTAGTPTLNKYGEVVLICDIDGINSLI